VTKKRLKLHKRLTDIAVKKLPNPSSGQVTYWDELTPAFGIRCSSKSKSFVVMYGEMRRLKTIGRYPDISLQNARKEARLFLSEVSFGKHQSIRVKYEDAVQRFLHNCEDRLRPITVREYRRHLGFFAFDKHLDEIERQDVFRKLDQLKSTPTNQNYAFTAMKVFFNWSVRNQLCTNHPIATDKKPSRLKPRERVLSDDELRILYKYVRENRSLFHDLVALLILTGQRRSEICNLQWDEINNGCIELSSERTKNHRSHRVPLPSTALHIIETREGAGDYIFPSRKPGKPFNGFHRTKEALDKATGLEHFTLHDLRRTLSSNLARLCIPIHVTEKILNHTSGSFGGVAGIYNRHSYIDEMTAALQQYDDFLDKLISS
jgi:integrase